MLKNYLKIAWRNILRDKWNSAINIIGLSISMAVVILIGLWLYDELSYNKYHKNYQNIAQVMQQQTYNGEINTQSLVPLPIANELRALYSNDLKSVVLSTNTGALILSTEKKKLLVRGKYMEPYAPKMLTLRMIEGNWNALKDQSSIILSKSVADAFFGEANPMDKLIQINDEVPVKVTGVYEDLPYNSDFKDLAFIAPFDLFVSTSPWVKDMKNPWGLNAFQTYVQLENRSNLEAISAKIKGIIKDQDPKNHRVVFLHPMSKWHLYSEFKNGINTGGLIQFTWLFGIIGFFILLLACINFMNLSSARSLKRAKEVGIRKTLGSLRSSIIFQFFSESLMIVAFSFILALSIAVIILPYFNDIADKKMSIAWGNTMFWLVGLCVYLITSTLAGSYPALYLSSFQPIKVLKGTFNAGRFASLPRKILVVLQFTVSIILIVGTIVVYQQIRFASNRPVGYDRNGLIVIKTRTDDIRKNFTAFSDDLKKSGMVIETALSVSPTTAVYETFGDIIWKGKDPNVVVDFPVNGVTSTFGKTVGWQFIQGRDFSAEFPSDSAGLILNETAVKFMGLKHPVDQTIKFDGHVNKVIGVIKDMIVESPYAPVRPLVFYMAGTSENANILHVKINPKSDVKEALSQIGTIYKKYDAVTPFDYQFVSEEYALKFIDEKRIAELASIFSFLAVLISCLGVFSLASFMAEQRIKEIGLRKVLGASVFDLWQLLAKEFVVLVTISFLIAAPVAFYFMYNWLHKYEFHSGLSWWIFFVTGVGILAVTLMTISYQGVKAALRNPAKSLRTQ